MDKVKTKNLFKILAVGFIIVICPAASWVYLQKGLNYQKEARKEIVVKNTLDVAKLIPEHIKADSSLLDNRLRVILFDTSDSPSQTRRELKLKLMDQFENSQGVFVLEFIKSYKSPEVLENELLSDMHLRKELAGDSFDKLLSSYIGQPTFQEVDGKLLLDHLKKDEPLQENSTNFAVLVDHKNGLRNFYDTTNSERVKKLVEHMAILIPRKDIEKAELIREREI